MKTKLPLADTHARELETCGYCPKLCRATCTVSNALPSESLTPWGKMSIGWLAARGDLPLERSVTELPWACCGCRACSDFCEHKNPVSETLLAMRAEYRALGHAPEAVESGYQRFRSWLSHAERNFASLHALAGGGAQHPLLVVGCSYLRHSDAVAVDIVRGARRLLGPVELSLDCCGLYARQAGDSAAADAARERLTSRAGSRRLVFADAGCAFEYRELAPVTLVELAAEQAERLRPLPEFAGETVRYHDPCRLARGLSLVEAPRLVLERALGRPAAEFERRGSATACSGGGGLLPLAYPEVSRSIADERIREHERLGGGSIVTACAASLARFRSRGAKAFDIASLIERSLAASGAR